MAARYETLTKWVNENGWTFGAELGVFSGRTHLYLLEHCPALHLIGVDVWDLPGFTEGATKSGEKCRCEWCNETRVDRKGETAAQMRDRVVRHTLAYGECSEILRMPTMDAAKQVVDGSLDFVFIDADHSLEGVSQDIASWRPKLRAGGWLIGHDYNMQSVVRGILQHFPIGVVRNHDDHVWTVQC